MSGNVMGGYIYIHTHTHRRWGGGMSGNVVGWQIYSHTHTGWLVVEENIDIKIRDLDGRWRDNMGLPVQIPPAGRWTETTKQKQPCQTEMTQQKKPCQARLTKIPSRADRVDSLRVKFVYILENWHKKPKTSVHSSAMLHHHRMQC